MNHALIRRPGSPGPASETAAFWVLRQENGPLSDDEQQRFAAWLADDPAHVAAYEDALWALDAPARHAAEPALMEMREAALAARGERRPRGWTWSAIGGALAASVAALWMFSNVPERFGIAPDGGTPTAQRAVDPATAAYRTAIGERLAVTLPDGSVATLDTDSRIRVAYSGSERGVHLLRGQALFEVAHGRPLPFQVHAGGQRIVAVGTTFNVRLDGDRVRVALVEGVIRVRPEPRPTGDAPPSVPAPPRELVMRAGEMLEFAPARPIVVRRADVAQAASWRTGELVFNDTRLSDAVAEINRYTNRPIAIADGSVGAHRVTGVFRTNDSERFSQAMSEVFPIEVTHDPDGSPRLRARD